VVHVSRIYPAGAWSLKLGAWGLILFVIIYISLVLEAWSLTLGSFGRSGRDSSAWRLELAACRFLLSALRAA